MLIFFIICMFSLFINYNYIEYNENFLLCIFFILFFILVSITVKKNIKKYTFFKIFKNYFLNVIVLRLNNYINKLLRLNFSIKVYMLAKYLNKIILLKKKNILSIYNLFNYYIIILHYIYFINKNQSFILKVKQSFLNYYFFYFLKKIKKNDKIFF